MTSILFGPKRSVYCPHAVGEFVFCKGDPNAEWPGTTWERHDEGVYLVAAGGTYRTGGRYGENAHALTAAELPWHAHALLCNLASGSSMSGGRVLPRHRYLRVGLHQRRGEPQGRRAHGAEPAPQQHAVVGGTAVGANRVTLGSRWGIIIGHETKRLHKMSGGRRAVRGDHRLFGFLRCATDGRRASQNPRLARR